MHFCEPHQTALARPLLASNTGGQTWPDLEDSRSLESPHTCRRCIQRLSSARAQTELNYDRVAAAALRQERPSRARYARWGHHGVAERRKVERHPTGLNAEPLPHFTAS